MSANAPARPQHHTAAEVAKLEKQMTQEENFDKKQLKGAQKALAAAEKGLRKAEKVRCTYNRRSATLNSQLC